MKKVNKNAKPANFGQPYTNDEIVEILSTGGKKEQLKKIADDLDRTYFGVQLVWHYAHQKTKPNHWFKDKMYYQVQGILEYLKRR